MSEEHAQESQEETEGQGQAPEENTTEQTSEEQRETFSREYVQQLRQEAAAERKKRQALEADKKKREQAEQTELEQAQTRLAEAEEREQKKTQRLRRAAFNEQINLPNSRWAWAAAQDAGIAVEFDDDDNPTNLDSVRKELKKLDPTLFGDGPADAGVRQNGQTGYQGSPGRGRIAAAYANKT